MLLLFNPNPNPKMIEMRAYLNCNPNPTLTLNRDECCWVLYPIFLREPGLFDLILDHLGLGLGLGLQFR